jgi:zinc transporter ZupT
MLGTVLESLQAFVPGLFARPQILLADLFGVAAGILLGLNIRVMFNSAKSPDNLGTAPSRSTIQ